MVALPSGAVQEAVKQACAVEADSFRDIAIKKRLQDGSTATFAIVLPDGRVFTGNVGDSRTMVCERKGGRLRPLFATSDHKCDTPSEGKRIRERGGFVTLYGGCARLNGSLAMSRAFGDVELEPVITAEPDVIDALVDQAGMGRRVAADDMIVLASDGLWDNYSEQQAAAHVQGSVCRDGKACQVAAKLLCDAAIRHPAAQDNVTVLVVRCLRAAPKSAAVPHIQFQIPPASPTAADAAGAGPSNPQQELYTTLLEKLTTSVSELAPAGEAQPAGAGLLSPVRK